MGLLGDVYSAIDTKKRQLKGLLVDPAGTLDMGVRRFREDQQSLQNLFANAYPMAGDKTVLNSPQQIAQFQREAANKAGEMGLAGTIAGKFEYPQGKALETAKRNAAKPISEGGLGLPANNTAMDRARAMGYDQKLWHETSASNLDEMTGFNPNNPKAARLDEQTPYAVFMKSNPKSIGVAKNGEVQMPLLANTGNQRHFRDRDSLQSWLNNDDQVRDLTYLVREQDKNVAALADSISDKATAASAAGDKVESRRLFDSMDDSFWKTHEDEAANLAANAKQRITDKFTAQGDYKGAFQPVDSVRIENDAGSFGRNVDTTMVFDPSRIRSRFAAFDPARRNESDILGRASPELLKLLAGGTAGGLLGYNALKD